MSSAGAHAAVAAAADAQRAVHAEPWANHALLRVRMGLHTGEAELRDGDYYGSTLNRAARLMSAAHGGQIGISRATEELVRDTARFEATAAGAATPVDDLVGDVLRSIDEYAIRDRVS
jgi:class 3 adenylate cyclase